MARSQNRQKKKQTKKAVEKVQTRFAKRYLDSSGRHRPKYRHRQEVDLQVLCESDTLLVNAPCLLCTEEEEAEEEIAEEEEEEEGSTAYAGICSRAWKNVHPWD